MVQASLVVPVAAGLLLIAACGNSGGGSATTPASSDAGTALLGPLNAAKGAPVKIGMIYDGKSPAGDTTGQALAADATVKWLNEHQGGIGGRPIQLVKCVTLADPAKATDCANQEIENKVVAVVVGPSAVQEDIWTPLHAAQIPIMFEAAGGAGLLTDKTSTFNLNDPIFPLINLPLQLAKEKGIKKVADVVIDVPSATVIQKSLAPEMFKAAGVSYELLPIPPGTADMTPQLQRIVSDGTGLIHVLGSDAFCIAAFKGLQALGYTGEINAYSSCITDATRKAVPGSMLKRITVSATMPIGTDNPSTKLYKAVATTYGQKIDTSDPQSMSLFVALGALQSATQGITGDITPATIISTIKAMPEKDLPGETGLRFRCNGKASAILPATCVRGGQFATLDDKGQPSAYQVTGTSTILN
jgi:branched-chain amino acid transport system substrate-binding protein